MPEEENETLKRGIAVLCLMIFVVLTTLFIAWHYFDFFKTLKTHTDEYYLRHIAYIYFDMYKEDMGEYPTTEEGLDAFSYAPKGKESRWKGPYGPPITSDRWGRDLKYRCPGVHNPESYDIWSLGKDGVPSEDDFGNWFQFF